MKGNDHILIADFGATNVRICLTNKRKVICEQRNYLLSDYSSAEDLITNYFEDIKKKVTKGVIGVAAPVIRDEIIFTNTNIKFNRRSLKEKLFFESLEVLNDLELQAYALDSLIDEDLLRLGKAKEQKKGTKVLISPGSGLGLAGLIEKKVVFTEGGHLKVPSYSDEIGGLVTKFKEEKGRAPDFEDLLSGKGINFILRSLKNCPSTEYSNEEILNNSKDKDCLKTREILINLLSTYAQYIALIWGATSGVFFSGSIANTLLKPNEAELFRRAFESSSKMKDLLQIMPTFLIKDIDLGLKGGLVLASRH